MVKINREVVSSNLTQTTIWRYFFNLIIFFFISIEEGDKMKIYNPTNYSYITVVEIPKTEISKFDMGLCQQPR